MLELRFGVWWAPRQAIHDVDHGRALSSSVILDSAIGRALHQSSASLRPAHPRLLHVTSLLLTTNLTSFVSESIQRPLLAHHASHILHAPVARSHRLAAPKSASATVHNKGWSLFWKGQHWYVLQFACDGALVAPSSRPPPSAVFGRRTNDATPAAALGCPPPRKLSAVAIISLPTKNFKYEPYN